MLQAKTFERRLSRSRGVILAADPLREGGYDLRTLAVPPPAVRTLENIMRPILKWLFVALLIGMTPGSLTLAQESVPATPMPNLDICGDFLSDATPIPEQPATNIDAGFDLSFVDMMITSHQNTIIMLLIAGDRVEHPELADFVTKELVDRRATIETLLGWRSAHHGGASWLKADQAMAIFDEVAAENPGRGGVAGAREIANEPHIEELCSTSDVPFDLLLIDHLLPQIAGELLLAESAMTLAQDDDLKNEASSLATTRQQQLDGLYAWRSLWYPDAGELHSH